MTANQIAYYPQSGGSGAMVLIQKQTVSEAAASVTFSAIPQTYTHLKLVIAATSTTVEASLYLAFNGDDTKGDYQFNYLDGANAAATSGYSNDAANIQVCSLSETGAGASSCEITIPNYAAATPHSVISVNSNLAITIGMATVVFSGYWTGGAGITSLELIPDPGSIDVGSVFSLYGLA